MMISKYSKAISGSSSSRSSFVGNPKTAFIIGIVALGHVSDPLFDNIICGEEIYDDDSVVGRLPSTARPYS